MKIDEFEKAIQEDDFSLGDSFWLGDWEFQVVSRRNGSPLPRKDDVVFKWELTKDDFIQGIKDSHPEIKDSEEFFERYRDGLIHYFGRGFDALLSECGINYETVIRDALEELMEAK